jgi:hypothetical protein
MIGTRYSAMLAIASSVSGSLLVSPCKRSPDAPTVKILAAVPLALTSVPSPLGRLGKHRAPAVLRHEAMVADAAFRVAYPTYTARIAASAVVKHHGLGADSPWPRR